MMNVSIFATDENATTNQNMKCIVALFALLAVASAQFVAPSFYSGYGGYPYGAVAHGYAAPYAHGYAAPYAHAYAAPYAAHAYAAPAVHAVHAVPSGYVAQTRGSLHVAPHPEGPFTASHHINTAPAPGTY